MTPRLPAPAPRSAQNRSPLDVSLAVTSPPFAFTNSIDKRLSQASPNCRTRNPSPPAAAWPAMPIPGHVPPERQLHETLTLHTKSPTGLPNQRKPFALAAASRWHLDLERQSPRHGA